MGSLSNYSENALLGHLFTSAYTAPAGIYLALLTADPTAGDGASITEAANANSYARTAISFGAASARRVTQDALLTFPAASGSWGTITHWALTDSATYGAGNVLAHGAFSSSFSPVAGNTPKVAAGQVYVEITASSGAGFTTATANALLDLMFNGTAFASPAGSTYIALLNATASDTTTLATMTECAGTAYAREEIHESGSASSPRWEAITTGATQNNAAIDFGTVGAGGWTQVVATAIVTAATGTSGLLLGYDNTNVVDQTPAAGDTVQFATGAFDVSLS